VSRARYISYRQLKKAGACGPALAAFARLFGKTSRLKVDRDILPLLGYDILKYAQMAATLLLSRFQHEAYDAEVNRVVAAAGLGSRYSAWDDDSHSRAKKARICANAFAAAYNLPRRGAK
jgi:hypothetical protein